MNKITHKSIAEIKKHLRRGDYEMISMLTNMKYKPETIRRMINGQRTINDTVIAACNKLIESRKRLLSM
jgi:hypothetical protein